MTARPKPEWSDLLMPRHNRPRSTRRPAVVAPEQEKPISTDEMASRLVAAGKANWRILESRPGSRRREVAA